MYVDVLSVWPQVVERRVVGPHGLAGQRLGIGPLLRGHLQAVAVGRLAEAQPRPGHPGRSGPGDGSLLGRIGAELDVNLLGLGSAGNSRTADESRSLPALANLAIRRQRHGHHSEADRRKDLPPREILSAFSGAHKCHLHIALNMSLRRSWRSRLHARYLAGERARTVR